MWKLARDSKLFHPRPDVHKWAYCVSGLGIGAITWWGTRGNVWTGSHTEELTSRVKETAFCFLLEEGLHAEWPAYQAASSGIHLGNLQAHCYSSSCSWCFDLHEGKTRWCCVGITFFALAEEGRMTFCCGWPLEFQFWNKKMTELHCPWWEQGGHSMMVQGAG